MAWLIVGRGRAQARAAASARRLRMIIDAAPTLIYYIDRDERFRFQPGLRHAVRSGAQGHRGPSARRGHRHRAHGDAAASSASRAGRPLEHVRDVRRPPTTATPVSSRSSYAPDAPTGRSTASSRWSAISPRRGASRASAARLLDLEQRRRHEAEAIADLGRLLTQRLELDAVAHRIAELSRILLGGIAATAYRLEESGALVALAVSGDMGELKAGGVVPPGAGVAGLAVARGVPVTTVNVLEDPQVSLPADTRRWIELAPYRAVLAVPFSATGRVIGAFAIGRSARPRVRTGRRPAGAGLRRPRRRRAGERPALRGGQRTAAGSRDAGRPGAGHRWLARPRHRARADRRRGQGALRRGPGRASRCGTPGAAAWSTAIRSGRELPATKRCCWWPARGWPARCWRRAGPRAPTTSSPIRACTPTTPGSIRGRAASRWSWRRSGWARAWRG